VLVVTRELNRVSNIGRRSVWKFEGFGNYFMKSAFEKLGDVK
jgi:hypothetical protein